MSNEGLILAWARITAFWISVIVLFSDVTGFVYLSFSLVWAVGIALISTAFGVISYFTYRFFFVNKKIADTIEQTSCRGGRISIGQLPQHPAPKQGGFNPVAFNEVMDFNGYARMYPAHAALMLAGAKVMMSVPGLPASPVKGGHGGATLFEHSLNVVKAMAKAAPTWKFYGHKNKDGSFWHQVKVVDGVDYHAFNMADPLLPLTAFLHDIGKVVCYELQKDGSVREKTRTAFLFEGSVLDKDKSKRVKVEHDTEGARLLRRMPELWDLPREDSRALLFAVSYYHKVGSVPASEWITDRARSLIELLILADNLAGQIESGEAGEHPLDQDGADSQPIPVSPPLASQQPPQALSAQDSPLATAPSQMAAPVVNVSESGEDECDGDDAAQAKLLEMMNGLESLVSKSAKKKVTTGKPGIAPPTQAPPAKKEMPPAPAHAPENSLAQEAVEPGSDKQAELSDHDPEMLTASEFDVFLDILLQENRINGKHAPSKIGFKYGEWLYISDAHLRSALAKELADPSFATTQEGVIHPWTRKLLKRLDAMGVLKKDFDGMQFRYVSALFTTESKITSKEGTKINETKYVMLVRASILGSLERMPDCLYPPRVTKCSFGNTRAINKAKPASVMPTEVSEARGSESAPPSSSVVVAAPTAAEPVEPASVAVPSSIPAVPAEEHPGETDSTPDVSTQAMEYPEVDPSPVYEAGEHEEPTPDVGGDSDEPDFEVDEDMLVSDSWSPEDDESEDGEVAPTGLVSEAGGISDDVYVNEDCVVEPSQNEETEGRGAAKILPDETHYPHDAEGIAGFGSEAINAKSVESSVDILRGGSDSGLSLDAKKSSGENFSDEVSGEFVNAVESGATDCSAEGVRINTTSGISDYANIPCKLDLDQGDVRPWPVVQMEVAPNLNSSTNSSGVDVVQTGDMQLPNEGHSSLVSIDTKSDYDFGDTLPLKDGSLELDLAAVLIDVLLQKRYGPQAKSILNKPGGKTVAFFDLEETLDFYKLDLSVTAGLEVKDGSNTGRKYIRIET